MRFGVTLPNFDYGALPTRDHIWRVAEAAEAAGYDSVWASDHILVEAIYPRFGTLFEVMTTLGWLAGQTTRLRLGTSVMILPMRNALLAAKEAATLDALSDGRVVLGVGAGWSEGEYRFLGADFHQRGRVLDESIQVIRNLWTEPRPSFEGRWYRYAHAMADPKPVQKPGPPIWIGGNSDAALRRAAALGDAWHADDVLPDAFAVSIERLRALAREARREVDATIRMTVDLYPATGAPRESGAAAGRHGEPPREAPMKGPFESMRELARRYRDLGVSDFICQFEHDSAASHVEFINRFAQEVIARL